MASTGPLNLHRTKRVGDREYAYVWQVVPGDVHWFYMPYGTACMYLKADPRTLDWSELGRRYGVNHGYAQSA